MHGNWRPSGLKYSRDQAELARQNKSLGVMNLPRGAVLNQEKCIMSSSDQEADRTRQKTVSGSVTYIIPLLTESEKSKLMVIKREVGRGYAVTMNDLHFLIEVIDRCGL